VKVKVRILKHYLCLQHNRDADLCFNGTRRAASHSRNRNIIISDGA